MCHFTLPPLQEYDSIKESLSLPQPEWVEGPAGQAAADFTNASRSCDDSVKWPAQCVLAGASLGHTINDKPLQLLCECECVRKGGGGGGSC